MFHPNWEAVELAAKVGATSIAEVGVYRGLTSMEFAKVLDGGGELHLFDFEDHVVTVARTLRESGYANVVPHGNSRKKLDSYNWSLMRLIAEHDEPIFDFVLIDGAHTWHHDGFAFFLCDRLLRPGGHLFFDDCSWSISTSPTMNPRDFPPIGRMYTREQIEARQVELIIDLLVRRDPRYREVISDKAFRKSSS